MSERCERMSERANGRANGPVLHASIPLSFGSPCRGARVKALGRGIEEEEMELREAFRILDKDNQGTISVSVLKEIIMVSDLHAPSLS